MKKVVLPSVIFLMKNKYNRNINPIPIMIKSKYVGGVWISYDDLSHELYIYAPENNGYVGWNNETVMDIYNHETSKSR